MNQVQAELQHIGVRCSRGLDEVGDTVDEANHMVELGTELAVRDLYQHKSRQIERAWARFRNGQYGICESCGA
jgi:RNA polymerase-binding transcription factor DksA